MSSGRASVLSGTVTRTWFTGSSTKGTHIIQLRHNTVRDSSPQRSAAALAPAAAPAASAARTRLTRVRLQVSGYRYAIVDGREVHGSDGTTSLLSQEGDAHDIMLSVGESTAVVRISPCGSTGFEYLCSFNGSMLTELNLMAELAIPADTFEVSVPRAETLRDEAGKNVVYYRIDSVRGDDGQEKSALHRFSEFDEVRLIAACRAPAGRGALISAPTASHAVQLGRPRRLRGLAHRHHAPYPPAEGHSLLHQPEGPGLY